MSDASPPSPPAASAPADNGRSAALLGPIGAAREGNGPAIWAIGGGKGGVGKSMIATNLAVALVDAGHEVCLVDGDLGGANLDTFVGCPRPPMSLGAFFRREVSSLSDLAIDTGIPGLRLIAGDDETLGAANPAHAQKLKLVRHLRRLPAKIVLLDLGAGTSFNTLDLFLAADLGLVITVPEPTAIQNCFAFLKAVTLRDLERRAGTRLRAPLTGNLRAALPPDSAAAHEHRSREARRCPLVVNRARASEGRAVVTMLSDLSSRFLGAKVQLAGVIREDPAVRASVQAMAPLLRHDPSSGAAQDLRRLADELLVARSDTPDAPRVRMGINEQLVIDAQPMHLQTEDLGEGQSAIRSQVFFPDGSVAYSRRTPYQDRFFAALRASPETRSRFHHAAIKKALLSGRIRVQRSKAA